MAKNQVTKYVAIDLGTSKTRIYISGHGIIFDEATVLVTESKTSKVIKFGNNARDMIGKTSKEHNIIYPIVAGVISDFNYLNIFLNKAIGKYIPELKGSNLTLACVSTLSPLEKSYLLKSMKSFGPANIFIQEDSKLALYGSNYDITASSVLLGIDMGAGKTTATTVVGNSILSSVTSKKGGNSFDEDITKLVKQHYSTLIGPVTAEEIKTNVVSLLKENKKMQVFGYDVNTGMPNNIEIDGNIFNKIVVSQFELYSSLIATLLEKSPREAVKDICRNGIIATGGMAKIKGVKEYFSNYFSIPVILQPKNCELATINGAIKYESLALQEIAERENK